MRSATNAMLLCLALVIAWGTYRNSPIQPCSYNNHGFDMQSTPSSHTHHAHETTTATSSNKSVGPSRIHRLARYKHRYNYKPPATHITTEDAPDRAELCGTPPEYETFFSRSGRERSANNEDRDLYQLFFQQSYNISTSDDTKTKSSTIPHHSRHTIVEMGAYNGIQESNSRFFEACLGWDALLIEGMPETYDLLVKNRPRAHRMNFAPSCSAEDDAANATVKFDNYPMTNAGLGQHVQTSYSGRNWTVDVPCGSLTDVLLDVFPHGHVTLFSLDVEGSEPLIVRHIDFDRVFIEIMIIEHNNNFCKPRGRCQSRDEFRKIMDENGYIRFTKGVSKSDLFIHPESKHYLNMALEKREHFRQEYERFVANKEGSNEIPVHATW